MLFCIRPAAQRGQACSTASRMDRAGYRNIHHQDRPLWLSLPREHYGFTLFVAELM